MNEILLNTAKKFFLLMWTKIDELYIEKKEEHIYFLNIKTPDSPIIIWYSWENLNNIQIVLKKIFSHLLWKNIILHMEVNDYFSKKDKKLYEYIDKKIKQLEKDGKEIILPFFSPYERKKIHDYVKEVWNNEFLTKSIWEWKNRKIHIYKRNLKIDLEWIWI